jgi:hypothetical protein
MNDLLAGQRRNKGKEKMRIGYVVLTLAMIQAAPMSANSQSANRFDGSWTTTVSCPDAAGALGYSFDVPTTIHDGLLHGERMREGEPGHLLLDGQIQPDGQARMYAKGLVGASQFAVGQAPKGTDYGYHVVATFQDASGSGKRVEGRPCDRTFSRR